MPQRHPNKFRFRLRTALVLVTLFSVYLAVQVNQARRTKLVIEEVQRLGGRVRFVHEQKKFGAFTMSATNKLKPPGPDWLRQLIGDEYFVSVASVNFDKTNITDADLERLSKYFIELEDLRGIHLAHTSISDRGVECLKKLDQLESLGLSHTNVTDNCMKYAGRLSRLKSLSIGNTAITDHGIKHIANSPHVVSLQVYPNLTDEGLIHLSTLSELQHLLLLGNEQVTDRGMEHLVGLTKLTELFVPERVSQEARQRLQEAIPNALIE